MQILIYYVNYDVIREGYDVYFSYLCKKYKGTGPKWLCQIK